MVPQEWLLEAAREDRNLLHLRLLHDRIVACQDEIAALYLRVSTLDQHSESQVHDLRQLAQQRGYEIVAEYVDRVTGTKAKRPGLDELLRDGRRGHFAVVLVWVSDRLARSTRHFLELLDEFNREASSSSASPSSSIPPARWAAPWS